ncbi:hypothetical protein ACWD04_33540 [Streptomyces sp. NPDC002911]
MRWGRSQSLIDGCDQHRRFIADGELVVPGAHGTVSLAAVDSALDGVALAVVDRVEVRLLGPYSMTDAPSEAIRAAGRVSAIAKPSYQRIFAARTGGSASTGGSVGTSAEIGIRLLQNH